MKKEHARREIKMIPMAQIEVLNPRDRNSRVFEEIVFNIKHIGLKKPITVTPRPGSNGEPRYLLICGEGRLKAFRQLGETVIPAIVLEVNDEDAFIMSLAENIARRQCTSLELLAGIQQLHEKGYDANAIAQKTGLSYDYVHGMLLLLQRGEERLLVAVETQKIPLNAALVIAGAGSDDKAIQTALQDAYESGSLRGRSLIQARRVIERRRSLGPSIARRISGRKTEKVTSSSLIRSYQREVERQRIMIRKSDFTQQRLLFVVEAVRQLLSEESFTNLLRAEGLDTLPKFLSERIASGGHV